MNIWDLNLFGVYTLYRGYFYNVLFSEGPLGSCTVIYLISHHLYYHVPLGGQWDLTQQVHHIPVAECPIQCFCAVENDLWIGINNSCVILNMETLKMEVSLIMMLYTNYYNNILPDILINFAFDYIISRSVQ